MTIEVENLSKRFNREWIFRNLTYQFSAQQIFAIVGPNGSGKSTLLQVLWGQLPPSSGTLTYRDGDRQVPVDEVYKFISIATPYMELIEEFTLEEMLRFHFRFKPVLDQMSLPEMMDRMQLRHAAHKAIANFSSGMRQRVKLAMAFYANTPLLFLDEPSTNLDKKASSWFRQELELQAAGRTIFIASNLPDEYPQGAITIDLHTYK